VRSSGAHTANQLIDAILNGVSIDSILASCTVIEKDHFDDAELLRRAISALNEAKVKDAFRPLALDKITAYYKRITELVPNSDNLKEFINAVYEEDSSLDIADICDNIPTYFAGNSWLIYSLAHEIEDTYFSIKLCYAAVKLSPEDSIYRSFLVSLLLENQYCQAAYDICLEGQTRYPTEVRWFYEFADALYRCGQTDRAFIEYESLVKRFGSSNDTLTQGMLSDAYGNMGFISITKNKDKAIEYLTKSLRMDPSNIAARTELDAISDH
jgi:tetratricopeptide (TPR) repeat protein